MGCLGPYSFLSLIPSTEPYYVGDPSLQNSHSISRVKEENSVGMASDFFIPVSYIFLSNAYSNSNSIPFFFFSFNNLGMLSC